MRFGRLIPCLGNEPLDRQVAIGNIPVRITVTMNMLSRPILPNLRYLWFWKSAFSRLSRSMIGFSGGCMTSMVGAAHWLNVSSTLPYPQTSGPKSDE